MLFSSSGLRTAVGFLLAAASNTSAPAQTGNTLHLTNISFLEAYEDHNRPASAIVQGYMRVLNRSATATGGFLTVSIVNFPSCPVGTSQQFEFRWAFAENVTQLVSRGSSMPPVVNMTFQILETGRNGSCVHEDPSMTLYASPPFAARPMPPQKGMQFFFDPSRHGSYGPPGSGNAFSHTPGPFQVYFSTWDNPGTACTAAGLKAGTCSFTIHITSFQEPVLGFDMAVIYTYGASPPPTKAPPLSLQQLLMNWAAGTGRFGSAISALTSYASWIPGYVTNYMYFAYPGNRTTIVWLATNQTNPGLNYVVYWDPDANRWVGWTPL